MKETLLKQRYRLVDRLGAGGMAMVWHAVDEQLERDVAVKVLSENLAIDPTYVARFRREAQVAAGLSHANLVAIYDFGEQDGRPYLVMELVRGESLADRIAAGTASELDSVQLATEMLEAMDHIHRAAIIHRDIKPGNVLMSPTGAKLADFGIAQPADATQLTKTGMVVGTRSYLAPEVMRGQPATVRSDLYSLGILLGEVTQAGASPRVEHLAEALAHEDPGQRPASAAAALDQLKGTEGSTLEAPTEKLATSRAVPPAQLRRSNEGARRRLALAAIAAALLIGVGFAALQGGDESNVATPASPGRTDPPTGGAVQSAPTEEIEEAGAAPPTTAGDQPSAPAPTASEPQPSGNSDDGGPSPHASAAGRGNGNSGKPKKSKTKGKGKD